MQGMEPFYMQRLQYLTCLQLHCNLQPEAIIVLEKRRSSYGAYCVPHAPELLILLPQSC